jgi:hypothetical protein
MTKRIQLIVTGRAEELALHNSLNGVFCRSNVEFLRPQRTQDFTSNRLGKYPSTGQANRGSLAAKMAAALVAAVHPGRRAEPADLVIAIDDLELENQDQAGHVVDYFARSVREHVEQHYPTMATRDRVYTLLRERASFHLLVPMLEAYFFGDEDALKRASATNATNLFNARLNDLEDFRVDDPRYLSNEYLEIARRGRRNALPHPELHPKEYLRYLCDPLENRESAYQETRQGAAALQMLAWKQVTLMASHTKFIRSMLADIADALELPDTMFPGSREMLTERKAPGILRNIWGSDSQKSQGLALL